MKNLYILFILIFIGCSNNQKTFNENEIDQLFKSKNLGLAYIEESKLEDAVVEFEKILTINPNESMAYANLALIYFRMGDLDKAKLLIKKKPVFIIPVFNNLNYMFCYLVSHHILVYKSSAP